MSSGKSRYIARFARLERTIGLLETITVMTPAKWWLSFEEAAPHQIATCTTCDPGMTSAGKQKTIRKVQCTSARAARKIVLSRRPTSASSTMTGSSTSGVSSAPARARKPSTSTAR
jgi:hypothetical protein